jgi:large subunit ribosomal protein L13
MLPKNKLSPDRMARLKVFVGQEHSHAAQKPQKVEVQ